MRCGVHVVVLALLASVLVGCLSSGGDGSNAGGGALEPTGGEPSAPGEQGDGDGDGDGDGRGSRGAERPATGDTEGTSTTPRPFQMASFVFDQDHAGSEPSLVAGPDGALYVCAPTGLVGFATDPTGPNAPHRSSHLWRSEDGGQSWTWLDPLPASPALKTRGTAVGGGDCDVAVDETGVLYLTDLTAADMSIAVSEDRGATWSWTTPAASLPADDRQWLATSGAGAVHLVFHNLATGLWMATSTDQGRTFLELSPIVSNRDRSCACPPSDIAVGPDGRTLAVAWFDDPNTARLSVAVSGDKGVSWEVEHLPPGVGPTSVPFVTLGFDRSGNLYLAWTEGVEPRTTGPGIADIVEVLPPYGGYHVVRMRVLGAGSGTWSDPVNVTDTSQMDAGLPWLVAGDAGRIAIAYARSLEGPEGAWEVMVAQSSDALESAPTFTHALASTSPALEGALRRPLADFFQSLLTPTGRVAVAWTSDLADEGMRMHFGFQTSGPTLLSNAP